MNYITQPERRAYAAEFAKRMDTLLRYRLQDAAIDGTFDQVYNPSAPDPSAFFAPAFLAECATTVAAGMVPQLTASDSPTHWPFAECRAWETELEEFLTSGDPDLYESLDCEQIATDFDAWIAGCDPLAIVARMRQAERSIARAVRAQRETLDNFNRQMSVLTGSAA